MAKVSPWSVKGVEPESREAAKIAARRAGMTLGQWLNNTIRVAAAQQLATPSPTLQNGLSSEMASYDESATTNGVREPHDRSSAPHGMAYRAHPPAPTNEAIFENILNLTNRIERTELKAEAAVAPLADQVEQLSGQVEQVSAQVEQVKSQTIVSTAPVERAVQRLSERLEKIEASRKADKDGPRRSLFNRDK